MAVTALQTEELFAIISRAWPFYIPLEQTPVCPTDRRVYLIKSCVQFFLDAGNHLVADVDWDDPLHVVYFNYMDFKAAFPYPDFYESLRLNFLEFMACVSISLIAVRQCYTGSTASDVLMTARMQDIQPYNTFIEMDSPALGTMMSLQGVVTRVTPHRPLAQRLTFQCQKCGGIVEVDLQQDGKFRQPSQCVEPSCRSFKFVMMHDRTLCNDWQQIRLQEIGVLDRSPRTVDVDLREDLIDNVEVGEQVAVAGVMKAMEVEVERGDGKRMNSQFTKYLWAHSVASLSGRGRALNIPRGPTTPAAVAAQLKAFSQADIANFRTITSHSDPIALLIASFCPQIIGQETLKLGLLLGLFGGSKRVAYRRPPSQGLQTDVVTADNDEGLQATQVNQPVEDGSNVGVAKAGRKRLRPKRVVQRGDIHVLLVGEPGMGKSMMLRTASQLSPRGVYVSGQTATSRGLTVTVIPNKDATIIEAGAMALSDNGICCIDEFDKMATENTQAILEAMEQQRISISKGGMVHSLSARTGLLAAANPVTGNYDRGKSISENVRLPPALMSRFDLVHVMLDNATRTTDVVDHVLSRSGYRADKKGIPDGHASAHVGAGGGSQQWGGTQAEGSSAFLDHLRERVQGIPEREYVAQRVLKKYIAFARHFCQPGLSPVAYQALQNFFSELRNNHKDEEQGPITTRQLQSLVRLSQARAKMVLAMMVEENHTSEALEVYRGALFDAALDDFGGLDFGRTAASSGVSNAKAVKIIVERLQSLAKSRSNVMFSREELLDLISKVPTKGGTASDVMLDNLNQAGYILQQGSGGKTWKFCAV